MQSSFLILPGFLTMVIVWKILQNRTQIDELGKPISLLVQDVYDTGKLVIHIWKLLKLFYSL